MNALLSYIGRHRRSERTSFRSSSPASFASFVAPNDLSRLLQPAVMLSLVVAAMLLSTAAQAARPYKADRGPDGKHPDLNGIWQTMNEANWDVELHVAKPSLQVREGPLGPVPAIKTMLSLIHI